MNLVKFGHHLTAIAACLIGYLFIFSAILKALDSYAFAVQLSYYGIIRSPAWQKNIALAVIVVEGLLGNLILAGGRAARRRALGAAVAMFLGFSILVAYGWAYRGLADCGCFGKYLPLTPGWTILKNMVCIPLALWARLDRKGTPPASGMTTQSLTNQWSLRWRGLATNISALGIILAISSLAFFTMKPPVGLQPLSPESPAPGDHGHVTFRQYEVEWQGKRLSLGQGDYLVALISDACEHCGEIIATLNRMAGVPDMPQIVGLVLGEQDTMAEFQRQYAPQFPMRLIEPLEFFELIGETPPRFVLLRSGQAVCQWDTKTPPDEAAIQEAAASIYPVSEVP